MRNLNPAQRQPGEGSGHFLLHPPQLCPQQKAEARSPYGLRGGWPVLPRKALPLGPGRARRGERPAGQGAGTPLPGTRAQVFCLFFFLSLKHPEMTKTKVGCAGPAPRHQGGAGSYASIAEPTTKDQNSNVKTHEILTYTKLGAFLFTSCFCYSVKPQVQSVSAYIDLFSFFSFLFFLFSEKQLKLFI